MIRRFKQTRITLSKKEVTIIHSYERRPLTWCIACGELARPVAVEDAAAIASALPLVIAQEITAGRLHCVKQENQPSGVCLTSLLAWKLA
jgi:hypothetical protein